MNKSELAALSGRGSSAARRCVAAAAALATAITLSMVPSGVPRAFADSAPANPNDPKTPPTAAIDVLPTVQHNGVAWNQLVLGNTVYVVGSFTRSRPSGSAAGQNEVVRNNILAYDLTTGALKTSFNPNLNAQAYAIAAAPDGSRIYVGGDFTSVGGTAKSRVAALDPTTGTMISSFAARTDGSVRALAATTSTVYMRWFVLVGQRHVPRTTGGRSCQRRAADQLVRADDDRQPRLQPPGERAPALTER